MRRLTPITTGFGNPGDKGLDTCCGSPGPLIGEDAGTCYNSLRLPGGRGGAAGLPGQLQTYPANAAAHNGIEL